MNPASPYPAEPILLVDDEPAWLHSLAFTLEYTGGFTNLRQCADSREVLGLLRYQPVSLILLDLVMPHVNGEDLLVQLNQEYPQLPVLVLTGLNQLETAVRCMKLGAFDYHVKTSDPDRLLAGIRKALEIAVLQRENRELTGRLLRQELRRPEVFAAIVTRSPKLEAIFRYLEAIAGSTAPVLFVGEAGSGKTLLAGALHRLAAPSQPWIVCDLAAPERPPLEEACLGGPGATGLFDQARGGVLLLKNIERLPIPSQAWLAALLRQGEYTASGSSFAQRLQVRLFCTSGVDLRVMVDECRFRKDLFFRLGTHQITVPPLREHNEDLPLLLAHFCAAADPEADAPPPRLPPNLAPLLDSYPFPGNVTELRTMVETARDESPPGRLAIAPFRRYLDRAGGTLHLPAAGSLSPESSPPLLIPGRFPTLAEARDQLIRAALQRTKGNQTLAARLLGISQPALSIHLKKVSSSSDER